jgi:predicted ATPase
VSLRFRKLRLQNWKNFEQVDVEIQDRIFLVGPNASGKSNFLDVFRFLRDLASTGGGFQQAVGIRYGVSAIRCLAARRYPDVQIQVEIEETGKPAAEWEYQLAFSQDNTRTPIVKSERVRHNGAWIHQRPDKKDEADPARLTQTSLEQVNVNQPFRDLVAFFASIRYMHIVPQLVREPDRSVNRTNDPFGGDFLEQVARTPEKTQSARLRRIQEALKVAVPQLQAIQMQRDIRGRPHIFGNYAHWRPQGAWQNEEQFSDGTLRLMGILWVTLEGGGPLLLEEPELSLHPEIVRALPQMFARVQRRTGRQIFLSTHSRELLMDDAIGTDEVLLLTPGNEGTQVSVANSLKEVKELLEGGLSLADVVMPKTRPKHSEQLTLFGDS